MRPALILSLTRLDRRPGHILKTSTRLDWRPENCRSSPGRPSVWLDRLTLLAGTVQTKPPILSPVAHSTKGQASEELRKLLSSLNLRMATVGSKCVHDLFPRETSRLQALRQAMLNAPLFGSPNNHSFSSMQVNISPLNKADLSSLGYSGMTHTDKHDDPFSLSLLICMSHLASDTDPGNFYIGETHEWQYHARNLKIGKNGSTLSFTLGESSSTVRVIFNIHVRKRKGWQTTAFSLTAKRASASKSIIKHGVRKNYFVISLYRIRSMVGPSKIPTYSKFTESSQVPMKDTLVLIQSKARKSAQESPRQTTSYIPSVQS